MNLKAFREGYLKEDLEAFAERMDVEPSVVRQWEKDGDDLSGKVIQKIAQRTGVDWMELVNYDGQPMPKAIELRNTWEQAEFTKQNLTKHIEAVLDTADIPEDQKEKYIDGLSKKIDTYK